MRAQEVFTPGGFPTHTYVTREEHGFEGILRDGLDTPGQLVSISGPSKSGKTVFVEKVVGSDLLITVTGAGVTHPEELWDRILDWMEAPTGKSRTTGHSRTAAIRGEAGGEAGIPLVTKGKASVGAELERGTDESQTVTFGRGGLQQVIEEIGDSDFVLLIDDFHYMPRSVQVEVAKHLKEAIRQGVRVVTAAVSHRSDDVVRSNPELRGRVLAIDFGYWQERYLREIGDIGFGLLNAAVEGRALDELAKEASGSPQLMQAICLNLCFVTDIRESLPVPSMVAVGQEVISLVLERTSSMTDFRSLVDALDTGPPTRGTERKTYEFADGTNGDVYRAILKAIALDPPQLSFAYEDLTARLAALCHADPPVGSSVISSCQQMAKLAGKNFPRERVIDWDEERGGVLDLPDPYLLFYLRWSSRLMES